MFRMVQVPISSIKLVRLVSSINYVSIFYTKLFSVSLYLFYAKPECGKLFLHIRTFNLTYPLLGLSYDKNDIKSYIRDIIEALCGIKCVK